MVDGGVAVVQGGRFAKIDMLLQLLNSDRPGLHGTRLDLHRWCPHLVLPTSTHIEVAGREWLAKGAAANSILRSVGLVV